MKQHRVRLSNEDLELIVAALAARLAMAGAARAARIRGLVQRLSDNVPGNPAWRFSEGQRASGQPDSDVVSL